MAMNRVIGLCIFAFSLGLAATGCATAPADVHPVRRDHDLAVPPPDEREPAARPAERQVAERLCREQLVRAMPLRDRIAQRFFVYIPRTLAREEVGSYLAERAAGGVILYRWNYENSEQLRKICDLARESAPTVLGTRILPFICADQEGGRVSALRLPDLIQLPSQHALARFGSEELVRATAYVNGLQMRLLGLSMNLAPVLDVTGDADASIIGDRAFGADPKRVAAFARAYLDGKAASGIIPVVKHFPGHGATRVDSHHRLPFVDKSREDLMAEDLYPFKAALAHGAPAVMTAHIVYTALDPVYPATLSRAVIRDLLRRDLGFDGLVISDGFEMGALTRHFEPKQALYLAIRAGVDMILLYTRFELDRMIGYIEELLAEGVLTEADIDEGVYRILELKDEYGLLQAAHGK